MLGFHRISIKSKMQLMVLMVSLSSILVVGYLGWSWARSAIKTTIFNQLTSVRSSKAYQIESYFNNLHHHVETLCEDPTVVAAMVEFNKAFAELNSRSIPQAWEGEIANYYKTKFFPRLSLAITGEPKFETYRPISLATKYLQYHYIAKNPHGVGKKSELVDAVDGTNYSKINAKYYKNFRNSIKKIGYYNFFLIDAKTGDVVYTVYKETDFGINLAQGVYRESNLAEVVKTVSQNPESGAIQLVDFKPYRRSYMAAAAFIAGPIYNESNLVVILAIKLPADEINNVLTGNKNWKQDGLGNTGKTYIVGAYLLMRSVSRALIEDPEKYKKSLRSIGTSENNMRLIEQLKTSILLQKVDTEVTREAIKGKVGNKIIKDERNINVLSSYSPLKIEGLNWGIIAEMDLSEAYQPIYILERYLLIAAAILILLIAYLAKIAADKFVKPIKAIAQASRQGGGEQSRYFQALMQQQGEIGELAKIVNQMTSSVQKQTELLAQKEQENEALLLNILPGTVVKRFQAGEQRIADSIQQTTVGIVSIFAITKLIANRLVEAVAELLNELIDLLDETANRFDVEKFKTIGDRYIAVCGLTKPRLDHAKPMVDFALAAMNIVQQFNNRHGTWLRLSIAIHSGTLMTGIVGTKKFSYELWGETWEIVNQLHAQAEPTTIRVSQEVYDRLHDLYSFQKDADIKIEDKGKLFTWAIRKGGLKDLIDNLSEGLDRDNW
jgi:class 3 adenylate cyclase